MASVRDADRFRRELDATMEGDPWYGSSISRILQGVDASAASAHPIEGGHSIWELVAHMTSWVDETRRRLEGGSHGDPEDGDWPRITSTTAESWRDALEVLREAHASLARTLASVDDSTLARQVAGEQVDANGRPVTIYRTVVGILQHDAYHAGQIAILKKALARSGA